MLKCYNTTMLKCHNKNRAASLLLVIFLMGIMLTASITISETIVRNAKVNKGMEMSEMAYYAASSAAERMVYKINKLNCSVGANCVESGSLWTSGPTFSAVDADITINRSGTYASPWSISAPSGKSIVVNLDLNGVNYPASITIGHTTSTAYEAHITVCPKKGSIPQTCDIDNATDTLIDSLPHTFSLDMANYYYYIRINNLSGIDKTFTFQPPDGDYSIPSGFQIKTVGQYSGYRRQLNFTALKWQIANQ